jgi:hypothetical protein
VPSFIQTLYRPIGRGKNDGGLRGGGDSPCQRNCVSQSIVGYTEPSQPEPKYQLQLTAHVQCLSKRRHLSSSRGITSFFRLQIESSLGVTKQRREFDEIALWIEKADDVFLLRAYEGCELGSGG